MSFHVCSLSYMSTSVQLKTTWKHFSSQLKKKWQEWQKGPHTHRFEIHVNVHKTVYDVGKFLAPRQGLQFGRWMVLCYKLIILRGIYKPRSETKIICDLYNSHLKKSHTHIFMRKFVLWITCTHVWEMIVRSNVGWFPCNILWMQPHISQAWHCRTWSQDRSNTGVSY